MLFVKNVFRNFNYSTRLLLILFAFIFATNNSCKQNKSELFIDNYTPIDLIVFKNDKKWCEVKSYTTEHFKNGNPGLYKIYVKKLNLKIIDSLEIELKQNKKYVLNLLKATKYFQGTISFSSQFDKFSRSHEELQIQDSFFLIKADYFEEIPEVIRVPKKSFYKPLVYIRREIPVN